jgi:hypothetical protein
MATNPVEIGKVGYASPPVHSRFQAGNIANPGGKPKNARNKLQGAFLRDLVAHYEDKGKRAIERFADEDPGGYIKAIVALMPKELTITREFEDLTDEQLAAALAAARSLAAAIGLDTGAREPIQAEYQQAPELQALSKAG